MNFSNIVLSLTAIFAGLMAGLFFSFSCAVMLGLKSLPDQQFIAAMQSINKAIQNPVFFIVFFGILLLLPYCTYQHYSNSASQQYWLLLSATILYFVAVFGTTVFGNIPLNNALEKFNLATATKEAVASQRAVFENRWNNLNHIRTVASIVSFIIVIRSFIVSYKDVGG